MKKKFKLGVIGAGFMATAIIEGVIKSKKLKSKDIIVSDISSSALDKIKSNLKVNVSLENKELINSSEYVLFAVKPQSLSTVLQEAQGADCNKFVSIMAGVKKERIKSAFPKAYVARCMPNTPCSIGSGAVGIDLSDFNDEKDKSFIKSLFTSLAVVVDVPEEKLNAVTGISGSSPAYFYLFVKGIIEAGVKNGLSEDEAKTLAVATMIGSGKMILSNPEKSLDELINAVCSKGGTTIQAVNCYNENNLTKITENAIEACVKRSFELENV